MEVNKIVKAMKKRVAMSHQQREEDGESSSGRCCNGHFGAFSDDGNVLPAIEALKKLI